MLYLITGQPGNGKTLYTLGLVEQFRKDEEKAGRGGRPVYQSGIPDLTLDWLALDDPKAWPSLPDGSIVVIDECQRVFPPRKVGAEVPPHVREFETHRHRGFDVFLITQHPQLLDIAVRKLTGRHYHLRRTFGQEVSTVYQWEEATDPNERGKRNTALTSRFKFPRERYAWYKSAEIHTVQKRLPWKPIAVLAGSLVAVVLLGWYAWHRLSAGEAETVALDTATIEASLDQKRVDHWNALDRVPRVPAWPWSAPFYDAAARIVSAPSIAGCMSMKIDNRIDCTCTDNQGAVVDLPGSVCLRYIRRGVFDPTKPVQDVKAVNVAYLNARDSQAAPAAAQSETPRPSSAAASPSINGS